MEFPLHSHAFGRSDSGAERRTWTVVILTAAMMVAEIVGGGLFRSMAVTADGWHMSTHAAALGIAGLAYAYARRRADDTRFPFGPWKVEALGGYTSAILLVVVALAMAYRSIDRLFHPVEIRTTEALVLAAIGLAVNVACAIILRGESGHTHGREGHDHHDHPAPVRHDLNLRAAYLHVIADATTSIGAIVALVVARFLAFPLLDPLMGIVSSLLICAWGYGLLRDTSIVLVDRGDDTRLEKRITATIEADGRAAVLDLHVWRVGRAGYSCALVLEDEGGRPVEHYHGLLGRHREIVHSTIEMRRGGSGS